MMDISEVTSKLATYIRKQSFKGYDPYDTLNSWFPFYWFGNKVSAVAIQIQKRNPFNIRPFIGVRKDINPKAMGLLLKAFCIQYKIFYQPEDKASADVIFNWLANNTSRGYSGPCWGYNFNWAGPQQFIRAYTPSSVVTSFVLDGIFTYYHLTGSEKAKQILIDSTRFFLNDIIISRFTDGIVFSYTPLEPDICYNASLLVAESLAKIHSITGEYKLQDYSSNAVNFVISRQKPDGRWNYSMDIKTKQERKQVDFHQGYVLNSIYSYYLYTNDSDPKIQDSIGRGLEFYFDHQFSKSGRALWRYPSIWPVDIHFLSQGIITFTVLSKYHKQYLPFAKSIAKWTIQNMYSNKGFFYYRRTPIFTNKISYMRWAQAWMYLALSILLEKLEDE